MKSDRPPDPPVPGDPAELMTIVSHELRQPLASIRGLTEMLLGHWADFSDKDKTAMLQQVLHDAERVGRLVDELLDLSRLESGRLTLHREETDLYQLVSRVVSQLELTYPALHVTVEVPPQLAKIVVDPLKLEQVLVNLLENACRHGAATGVEIMCAYRVAAAGELAEFCVCDHGAGIAAEDLPHITEKFYRGRLGDPQGLGLGLWISKEIVEAHGGQLRATSDPRTGTTVRFTIPLREAAGAGKLAWT